MSKISPRPCRILFVDDEQDSIDMMEAAAMNYPQIMFYLHRSIAGGMRTLHERNFDIDAVILDLSLTDGSGRRATEDIREQETIRGKDQKTAIFWYTGWPIDLDDEENPLTETFNNCGVAKVFRKPYGSVSMIEEVREIISRTKGANA